MTIPRLEVEGIHKSFLGTRALSDVRFTVLPGEVHAMVGENGAGKSTLMRILSGVLQPDRGKIRWDGQEVSLPSPAAARRLGIGIVHQELSLCLNLSVAENVFVGHIPRTWLHLVDRRRLEADTERLFAPFGVSLDPRAAVGSLSIAARQLVEIAKALSWNCKLLILDEPTSSLSGHEAEQLFLIIASLRRQGVSVVYISHKLDEVFRLADRITVLRDGQVVDTLSRAETDPDQIVRMMVGRQLQSLYPPRGRPAEPLLEVVDIHSGDRVRGATFNVRRGEIVGVAGLVGSGRTEMLEAVVGLRPLDRGEVRLAGRRVRFKSIRHAVADGIAFVPEDRKGLGLFMRAALHQNTAAVALSHGFGFVNEARVRSEAQRLTDLLRIRASSLNVAAFSLSGGNQQKLMLSKWLNRDLAVAPAVFLVDEPTRGVDVGAKAEIHHYLRRLADDGAAVLMVSSELPEVLGLSDRILVMRQGRFVAAFDAATATESAVIEAAVGRSGASAGGIAG